MRKGLPFRRTAKRNCQPRCVWIRDGSISGPPSPPRVTAKPCERIGRERERKRGWIRTSSDLRASLEVSRSTGSGCLSHAGCWQVFGLASISAFAASLLSTASQLQRASACRGIVRSPLRGSPELHRVPFYSLENTQRTNTGCSLSWHPIIVNSDGNEARRVGT